jgi:hypothetical protein
MRRARLWQRLQLAIARRARAWAEGILDEPGPLPSAVHVHTAAFSGAAEPSHGVAGDLEPPAYWLAEIRERAPHLLANGGFWQKVGETRAGFSDPLAAPPEARAPLAEVAARPARGGDAPVLPATQFAARAPAAATGRAPGREPGAARPRSEPPRATSWQRPHLPVAGRVSTPAAALASTSPSLLRAATPAWPRGAEPGVFGRPVSSQVTPAAPAPAALRQESTLAPSVTLEETGSAPVARATEAALPSADRPGAALLLSALPVHHRPQPVPKPFGITGLGAISTPLSPRRPRQRLAWTREAQHCSLPAPVIAPVAGAGDSTSIALPAWPEIEKAHFASLPSVELAAPTDDASEAEHRARLWREQLGEP